MADLAQMANCVQNAHNFWLFISGKLNDLSGAYTGMGAQISELYYRRGFSDGVMIVIQALVASA